MSSRGVDLLHVVLLSFLQLKFDAPPCISLRPPTFSFLLNQCPFYWKFADNIKCGGPIEHTGRILYDMHIGRWMTFSTSSLMDASVETPQPCSGMISNR
jgi:hypothetical protein